MQQSSVTHMGIRVIPRCTCEDYPDAHLSNANLVKEELQSAYSADVLDAGVPTKQNKKKGRTINENCN
ncbi:hypothetical protein LJC72_03140 [Bacteroides sp. OttesenSCG-928-D19]|nr:hypothetical protein [Bacteroides sp. OttesenSCG-928-D19]